MALRINIFKTPRHRKYEYIPRYYDPDKEEREERIRKAQRMSDNSIEGMKSRISRKMRYGGADMKLYESSRKKELRRSNLTLLAIIVVLSFVAFIAMEVYLPTLLKSLE